MYMCSPAPTAERAGKYCLLMEHSVNSASVSLHPPDSDWTDRVSIL